MHPLTGAILTCFENFELKWFSQVNDPQLVLVNKVVRRCQFELILVVYIVRFLSNPN